MRRTRGAVLAACLICFPATPCLASSPVSNPGPPIAASDAERTQPAGAEGNAGVLPPDALSMGQPPKLPFTWGPMAGYDFRRDEPTARIFANVNNTRLLGPVTGMLEGAIGISGSSLDGALGTYLGPPWVLAGFEYNNLDRHLIFGLILQEAGKRGGLFGRGDRIRLDYRPAAKEVTLGLTLRPPAEKYRLTRPRERFVSLPPNRDLPSSAPLDPELQASVREIVHAVVWMDRLLTPRFKPGDEFRSSALPYLDHIRMPGHTYNEEVSRYHHGLEMAFAHALDGDTTLAQEAAAQAEAIIYKEVVLPFNRLFGQEKKPNHAGGLCSAAASKFSDYLASQASLGSPLGNRDQRALMQAIFQRVLEAIQEVSTRSRERWEDSVLFFNNRSGLAWLPLNYGLRNHQFDTQAEWDAVLAQLTGQDFDDCNYVEYLMTEQFHLQTKTTIRETREYQVTIVHDFRGSTADGGVDIYGWDMVVDGYLAAFVEAIADIDKGSRTTLPQFFLFLDENYYLANKSAPIISYLENLYDPGAPPIKEKSVREQVEMAHATLLAAIASSPAVSRLSDEELRRAFKVNVNITNPFDLSVSLDVTRRDHRKLTFRDISEKNPGAGVAIFSGQGIGEHYNGPGWEDRSLLIRGPALVQLKDETRRLFLTQGFEAHEVPECLQPQPFPADYGELCQRLRKEEGWTTRVSIATNETGYGYKKASVLKTAMYNLAPDSSFLLTLDSLWLSDFWGSMFITAALRGVNVFPVAPSPGNAPSHGMATLFYLRENLEIMLRAQMLFEEEIQRNGGMLRVGVYAHAVPINDIVKQVGTLLRGRDAYPFLKERFPFHPDVDSLLVNAARAHETVPIVKLQLRHRPLLHMKTQLFGTRRAFQVFRSRQWAPILTAHLATRQKQVRGEDNEGITPRLLRIGSGSRPGVDSLAAEEGAIFTFTTGSQNQDPRSMLLDGEVLVAISGSDCLITGIDFMTILGISSWPASLDEFDQLFPPIKPSPLARMLMGLIKYQL